MCSHFKRASGVLERTRRPSSPDISQGEAPGRSRNSGQTPGEGGLKDLQDIKCGSPGLRAQAGGAAGFAASLEAGLLKGRFLKLRGGGIKAGR